MRLIDADSINWESVEKEHGARTPAVVACQSLIQNAPTIDPVRHGKWAKAYNTGITVYCGLCNRTADRKHKYCPNCGAKMDG